jgi:outer membrane protein OmpA-like peptidoglycan-associated protein
MKKIFLVFIALASYTTAWSADKNLLTPEPLRITDEAISADIKVIQGLQGRLAELNRKGVPIASYHFAKAQAWLDFALDEYTINDRTRVVEEALHQTLSLIEQMEAGKKEIGMSTPVIPTSSIVRADLWDKAETLKKRVSSRCTGDKVAQLEVQLVWAGHEDKEFGWRHSKPYIQTAERLAREADSQMEACPPQPPEPVAAKVEPTAAATFEPKALKVEPAVAKAEPAAPVSLAENIVIQSPGTSVVTTLSVKAAGLSLPCPESVPAAGIKALEPLPDRIHFAFDRADINVASSAAVLDLIAAAMKAEQTLRVVLYGHADQRGNLYYNMILSRQRAETVRAYLISAGIGADRISVAPIGKMKPLTTEKNIAAYARNRRVEFLFTLGPSQPSTPQQADLQPEKANSAEVNTTT